MNLAPLRAVPSDIYITEQLDRRGETRTDYLREKDALHDLAGRMLGTPEEVLPRFVELAMQITGGISAGLSLYEETPSPGVFRWCYLRGLLSSFEGALAPRNDSPCGVTLDEGRPVLASHPERYYGWIADAGIAVPEALLVPLHFSGSEPIGTLWIIAAEEGHFNAGHARAAAELAHFAGIAVRMLESQRQLKSALEQQEMLAREMGHRVNNLFTVAQSLVQLTARTSANKDEMAETLIGRFSALARAHALVRRTFGIQAEHCHELRDLLRTIVEPHENHVFPTGRFALNGPSLVLGERSLNGMALVFHELTTNAVKYGGLASDAGRVEIEWRESEEGLLEIVWTEIGGREIAETPELNGFGSKLLRDTITRQFGGTLEKSWARSGLTARITLPRKNLIH
ncbi:sensor histidine kinase [Rhizomicrobium electricum]|uniref:sensor histidine kinase n=1 Tax=Rhizomicrobium electricum TaxID=480070 RepID=UPI001ABABDDD|nr:HWE histidine kinase domain-containing protein [Rhizomicrobium electricum]NIJ47779.1 two-component sensor histidine kinase [Rhizomicrobium electricum]